MGWVERFWAATVLLVAVTRPLHADEGKNCDPKRGLTDGSCCETPARKWWRCDENTYLTPQERQLTPTQQRRLEDFALGIFSPELPGYSRTNFHFSRADLIKRFGEPLSAISKEAQPHDPTDPPEIVTTWRYRGFSITTVASKPAPDSLQMREGEVVGADVSLRYGVRVGQPIERWVRQFGRPNCGERHLVYDGEAYFACGENKDVPCVATYRIELFLDDSGRVRRMQWSHPML